MNAPRSPVPGRLAKPAARPPGELFNRNGARMCDALGCRRHARVVQVYRGLFCQRHAAAASRIRARIAPHRGDAEARVAEIVFRKCLDIGHLRYAVRLAAHTGWIATRPGAGEQDTTDGNCGVQGDSALLTATVGPLPRQVGSLDEQHGGVGAHPLAVDWHCRNRHRHAGAHDRFAMRAGRRVKMGACASARSTHTRFCGTSGVPMRARRPDVHPNTHMFALYCACAIHVGSLGARRKGSDCRRTDLDHMPCRRLHQGCARADQRRRHLLPTPRTHRVRRAYVRCGAHRQCALYLCCCSRRRRYRRACLTGSMGGRGSTSPSTLLMESLLFRPVWGRALCWVGSCAAGDGCVMACHGTKGNPTKHIARKKKMKI